MRERGQGGRTQEPGATRLLLALLFFLLSALHALPTPAGAATGWVGRPLFEVFDELQRDGLALVYSSRLVTPDLVVVVEPTASKPPKLASQVLKGQALELQRGPQGRLLVVEAPSSTTSGALLGLLRGRVLDDRGNPRGGDVVSVDGVDAHATVGTDGSFQIQAVPAGRRRVRVQLGDIAHLEQVVEVEPGVVTTVEFRVAELMVSVEHIDVVSKVSLLGDLPASGVAMDRQEIEAQPHFGDDLYRAVRALPGVTGDDFTAGFQLRGDRHNEVLVRLDGLELFEPFHLKDFKGLLSILDPEVIAQVSLIPGSFPAEYGDRSAGVVDMVTERPEHRQYRLGISFSNAWAGAAGLFDSGRGAWQGSARRGYLDLILDLAQRGDAKDDEDPSPAYWDAFGRVDLDLGASQRLGLNLLSAGDSLDFVEEDVDELTLVNTTFDNLYLWLTHQGLVANLAVIDTVISGGSIDHDRFGSGTDRDESFMLTDFRDVDFLGLRQDWSLEASRRNFFKWGLEARSIEVAFDYVDDIVREDPLRDPRFELPEGVGAHSFARALDGEHYSVYASDRLRLGRRLVTELGARYDRQTLTDTDQLSPRVNFLVDLGWGGAVRFGWGHFFQSQKPHELEVQFGETTYLPAQRSEHYTLGWQGDVASIGRLRIEAYRREIDDPQRRFATLFDPFKPLPQVAVDLVVIDPERVVSEGVEMFLSRRVSQRLSWWLEYVYSSIEDRVDGRWQPRATDQPHAFKAGVTYRPGPKWTLTGVFRHRTGWPSTRVDGEVIQTDEGLEVLYDVGPFYGERLPDYQSLDLRLSRTEPLRRGRVTFFLDVQNLLDHSNARGLEIEDVKYTEPVDGRFRTVFAEELWLGLLPSFGISWEF